MKTQKKYFSSNDARHIYDTYSFSLFPVHGINESGDCTCGNKECNNKGKHPATQRGLKDATTDIELLKDMWGGRQCLNVGIATGEPSGMFVIDIDGPDGEKALEELEEKNSPLPITLTTNTGKGRHLYFKYPGEAVVTKTKIIGDKVDVRGDGGYVVGPGSNHLSGNVYEFNNELEVIEEAPEWLLDLVVKSRIRNKVQEAPIFKASASAVANNDDGWSVEDVRRMLTFIDAGCDNDTWVSVGMGLKTEGMPFELFDKWSSTGHNYPKGETAEVYKRWNSFNSAGTTFGTVVHLAKQGGWKPKSGGKETSKIFDLGSRAKVDEDVDAGVGEEKEEKEEVDLIEYTMAKDIKPALDTNDLIRKLMGEGQFSVVYGESNCGKTFFITDIAFHIATGREYRGRRVEQGGVIYVALEGGYGLKNRIVAYREHNLMLDKDMPLAVITTQIDFLDSDGNIGAFINTIDKVADEIEGGVKLVVIDTLARAIAGGDENSGEHMGVLVKHADLIREATGAHICFVHHSGKNRALGARGHSSLRAAVDTELEISRDEGSDHSVIKVVKQREMEMDDDMHFRIKPVKLGVNKYEEDVVSCVVEHIDKPEEVPSGGKLTPVQEFVYDAVILAATDFGKVRTIKDMGQIKCITYFELYDVLDEMGYKDLLKEDDEGDRPLTEKAIKNHTTVTRVALKKKGYINFNKAYIWVINDED